MSTQNLPYIKVYNSVNSAANTIASAGGKVTVKDGSSNGYALLDFLTSKAIAGAARTMALAERPKIMFETITGVSTGTEFSFIISQDIDEPGGDGLAQVKISVVADATDDVNSIALKLVNQINANKQLKVTASRPSNDDVEITGDAGYPLFSISNEVNVSFADTTGGTPATASGASTANGQCVITVTGAGLNFRPGDTVTLASFGAGNGDYVVAASATNTVTVFTEGATITYAASGTVESNAQEARQVGADLKLLGKAENLKFADGQPHSELLDATLYTKAEFSFYAPKGSGGFNEQSGDQRFDLELYWDQSIAAATYDALETAVDAIIAALP